MSRGLVDAIRAVDADITSHDVADIVWLFNRIRGDAPDSPTPAPEFRDPGQQAGTPVPHHPEPDLAPAAGTSPRPRSARKPPARADDAPPDGRSAALRLPRPDSLADGQGVLTRSPGVRAIPNELAICRALRPFHVRVPSLTESRPDEQATADWIAETGLWIPSNVPVDVRWLDVALVVDDSASMGVWQRTVAELTTLLRQTGAFGDVRVWQLDTDLRHAPAVTLSGGVRGDAVRRDPREIVDPAGRRLTLVISDCVGSAWATGAIAPALETWARSGPTAIVQMLPQRLWVDCVPEFAPVRMHSPQPGAANNRLLVRSKDGQIDLTKAGVPVPVLQLEARWLRPWASMVAGTRDDWVHGVALFTRLVAEGGTQDVTDQRGSEPAVTAAEQLTRFRAHASPEAYQLLVCLAAAPLSLPVMRLVQDAMLPVSKPSHLAEVFLSGLLRRVDSPDGEPTTGSDDIQYDFQRGVRSALLAELNRHDALHVLSTVSTLVSERLGSPLDFLALLTAGEPGRLNGASLPFAYVAIDVLRSLGGRYGEAADRLARLARVHRSSDGDTRTTSRSTRHNSRSPVIDRGEGGTSTSSTMPAERHSLRDVLPEIMRGVPPRNPHFTGRKDLLSQLRKRLTDSTAQTALVPHALHGLGGVGKTQLAVEYVYRYAKDYDLVWWVSADDLAQVRASFVDIAQSLELPKHPDVNRTVEGVLDALRVGRPYQRWLLVFDNADHPGDLEPYLPYPTGHVLITSRNVAWSERASVVQVDVLERSESIALIQKRTPGISYDDADRLAERLDNLPLALENAAAWIAETGMSVEEYLELFESHFEQLADTHPLGYSATVGAAFQPPLEQLKVRSLGAAQLLGVCAFLGPAPISLSLLREGSHVALMPLRQTLGNTFYGLQALVRELGRSGLAKVDGASGQITVHRLVQLVVRAQLSNEERTITQAAAQRMLVNFSPSEPDRMENWPRHAELSAHILPSELINADDFEARRVVLDQIRYRWVRGDYESSQELGAQAVQVWSAKWGRDDELTLVACRHLANALRSLGVVERARALALDTWQRMRRVFGEDHDHTLYTADNVSWDLRISGDFRAALRIDEENLAQCRRVLGQDDPFTLKVANNRAVDLRWLGDFTAAREADEDSVRRRTAVYGAEDHNTLLSISSLARDLYGLGDYAEGLALQDRALAKRRRILGDRHGQILLETRSLIILLRKAGKLEEAREAAKELCDTYEQMFGRDHEHRLAAMMSYHNALRSVGDLVEARRIGEDTLTWYREVFGAEHPMTLACASNVAITLRLQGEADEALARNEATLAAFERALGPIHPFTLCCATSLGNDLAALGRHEAALARSRETLSRSTEVRGADHPYTYACMLNTALDLRANGDEAAAGPLLKAAIAGLEHRLGEHNPEVLAAKNRQRVDCDIEPSET